MTKQATEDKKVDLNPKIEKMKKAQIILYGILGVFSKSVELALECGDIELAKEYANKPMEKKVSRELWMGIAKHLFNTDNKSAGAPREKRVQTALEFIRLNSKLKVEDLLEEFPKEAKVEEMKQHLC